MRSLRVLGVTAASAALAVALIGCGSEDDADTSASGTEAASPTPAEPESDTTVLSQDEVELALLTAADIGTGFTETETDDAAEADDSESGDFGCLSELEDLDALTDPETEAEVAFDDGSGVSVASSVASFADPEALSQELASIRDSLEGCTSVDTEQDGVQISLTVSVDEERADSTVDEQLNIIASGTGLSEGLEIPVALGFSFARLENNLTLVGVLEFGGSGRLFAYTETAVAKLDAVMQGEPVPTPEAVGTGESEDEAGGVATASVGEPVAVGDWTVTVTEVIPNANDQIAAANEFNEPPQGQYVLVSYTATYGGAESSSDASFELFLSFAGSDNVIYQSASAVTPADSAAAPTEVRPGGTVTLDEVFDVPPEAIEGGSIVIEGFITGAAEVTF